VREALTAAREWGEKPRYMLGLPAVDRSEVDRLLMLALTIHDADKCPCGCGGYADVTLEVDGWHEAAAKRCDARRAMEDYRKEHPNAEPGELVYAYLDEGDEDD